MSTAAYLGQSAVVAIGIVLLVRWIDSRIMQWREEAERDAAEDAEPVLHATARPSVATEYPPITAECADMTDAG